jgi:hypothetical protein
MPALRRASRGAAAVIALYVLLLALRATDALGALPAGGGGRFQLADPAWRLRLGAGLHTPWAGARGRPRGARRGALAPRRPDRDPRAPPPPFPSAPPPAPPAAAADPRPPGEPVHKGGRALWQLGEDGGMKLAGASPPVAPQPRFWTFNHNCRPGVCSGLCLKRTGHYDTGRCVDATSGRRYCKCWRSSQAGGGAAA